VQVAGAQGAAASLSPLTHSLNHRPTFVEEKHRLNPDTRWAAADSMDTDLSSMSLLELYRADIADS